MTDIEPSPICPTCGAAVPKGWQGGCPRCLANRLLGEPSEFLGEEDLHETVLTNSAFSRKVAKQAPEQIGPFRILEELGEGGFGVVYRAEQTRPVRRQVALKVIKPGMASTEIVQRFEAERQALALMDHPHIAKVFDAGTTTDGRPYFVMELVQGQPLTRYCDERHLGIRERLGLFINVCAAVQHAHQKAVLHRDLKPSNILVAEVDGLAAPKVIDFGIAKALEQRLTEQTLYTAQGLLVGTPQYMSPEQVNGTGDVDTRSDIYSLGVVLYELLTGSPPVEAKRFKNAAVDEFCRIIREEEAVKPSLRIAQRDELNAGEAAKRHGAETTRRWTREVRGDLDWIVLRALEKDRERRYESAASLAADITRYLNNEPVWAMPPSAAYRIYRLSRKHWKAVATLALIFSALSAGLVVSTRSLEREKLAYAREAEQRQEAERQREKAEEARQKADAARMEESLARSAAEAATVKARQAENAEREAREAADQARSNAEELIEDMLVDLRGKLVPLRRTELLATVAESAERYFQDFPKHELTDEQWRQVAMLAEFRGMILLSRGDASGAGKKFEEALSVLTRRYLQSPDPSRRRDLAIAYQGVGLAQEQAGRLAEARRMFEKQLEILSMSNLSQKSGELDPMDRAVALSALARIDLRDSNSDPAGERLAEAEELLRRKLADDPTHAMALRALASVLELGAELWEKQMKPSKSREALVEALAYRRALANTKSGEHAAKRHLGLVLERLGTHDMTARSLGTAASFLRERFEIAISLAKADGLDVELQADLISAHGKLADLLIQSGERAAGLDHLASANGLLERQFQAMPWNVDLALSLASEHHDFARECLATGDPILKERALRSLSRGLEVIDAVPVTDTRVVGLRASLSGALASVRELGLNRRN
jgi:serine/threonine protein kinase/tetratricopeptide (TPR) repeat protein